MSLWNSVERLSSLISIANWGIAFTLLAAFACTVVVIKASSRKDDLTAVEDLKKAGEIADTKKLAEDAHERAEHLEHDNLALRGQVATLETNAANATKDLAVLQRSAADAKRAQQETETQLMQARSAFEQAQIDAANAKQKAAEASQKEIAERAKVEKLSLPRRLNSLHAPEYLSTLRQFAVEFCPSELGTHEAADLPRSTAKLRAAEAQHSKRM